MRSGRSVIVIAQTGHGVITAVGPSTLGAPERSATRGRIRSGRLAEKLVPQPNRNFLAETAGEARPLASQALDMAVAVVTFSGAYRWPVFVSRACRELPVAPPPPT